MLVWLVVLGFLASTAIPAAGQPTGLTGTFVRTHEDTVHADGSMTGRYRHFVVPDPPVGALSAARPGPPAWVEVPKPTVSLETGDRAEVARGRRALPAPSALGIRSTVIRPLASPTGQQRALLIVFTFNDQPAYTSPMESWRTFLRDDLSPRFVASSYGRLGLTWDVMGPYVLPLPSTGCPWAGAGEYANRAATAAGANITAYGRVAYYFPLVTGCGWAGLGTVGGAPGRAWLNGAAGYILDHELGHTLSLYHSHSCAPVRLIPGTPCAFKEYGDVTDVMGGSTGQFNPYQKARLGWLGVSGAPPMTNVTQSGEYTLDRYETPGTGPKALRIPRGTTVGSGPSLTGTALYVKRSCGVPGCSLPSLPIPPGINVYLNDGQADGSYLVDTSPATPTNFQDNEVTVGKTWTDAGSGIAITLLAADATTTRVRVTLTPEITPPPPPPPPDDGRSGGAATTYVVVKSGTPQPPYVVATGAYECVRTTGGSSFLSIYRATPVPRTLVKRVAVANPVYAVESDGVSRTRFTLRCAETATQVQLLLSGSLKVVVTK